MSSSSDAKAQALREKVALLYARSSYHQAAQVMGELEALGDHSCAWWAYSLRISAALGDHGVFTASLAALGKEPLVLVKGLRAAWANATAGEHAELADRIAQELLRLAPADSGFQALGLIHALQHGLPFEAQLERLLAQPGQLAALDAPVLAQLIRALHHVGSLKTANQLFNDVLQDAPALTEQALEIRVILALDIKQYGHALSLTVGLQAPRLRYLRSLACAQTLAWVQLAQCQLTPLELGLLLQSDPSWRPHMPYLLAHVPGYDDATLRALSLRAGQSLLTGQRAKPRTTTPEGRPTVRPQRLRIAYLSGDFRGHPVAQLLAPVLEAHDKTRFEWFALDNSRDDGSAQRQRILTAFDRVIPIRHLGERAVAQILASEKIDILVSLGGGMVDGREKLLAHSAVPVHMAWMGFPGSLGPPYVDYTVTDAIALPQAVRPVYAEAVVYLPVADRPGGELPALRAAPARRAQGLPEGAVVLACFNQHNKISAATFAGWCALLQADARSVLWLTVPSGALRHTVLQAAAGHGIGAERVFWVERLPLALHMERIACADLILDCHPFTMHATAVNALAAGVPFLTYRGRTSLGRVSASLLQTAGLGDCVCADEQDYLRRMQVLVGDAQARAGLRQRFAAARTESPLFDSRAYAVYLEKAYDKAHARWAAGLAPADIHLSACRATT